jgi:hypothetical protein
MASEQGITKRVGVDAAQGIRAQQRHGVKFDHVVPQLL